MTEGAALGAEGVREAIRAYRRRAPASAGHLFSARPPSTARAQRRWREVFEDRVGA